MIFLHIQPNSNNEKELEEYIKQDKHVFVLIYMEGCGPCNMTRPEWKKIENVDSNKNDDTIVVVDIDHTLLSEIKGYGSEPSGFPTMRYIHGDVVEEYEGDRDVDAFMSWINSKVKTGEQMGGKRSDCKRSDCKRSDCKRSDCKRSDCKRSRKTKKNRHTKKNRTNKNKTSKRIKKGGKWSMKYKKSINCKHPKGFSQRQHCKYGRK